MMAGFDVWVGGKCLKLWIYVKFRVIDNLGLLTGSEQLVGATCYNVNCKSDKILISGHFQCQLPDYTFCLQNFIRI